MSVMTVGSPSYRLPVDLLPVFTQIADAVAHCYVNGSQSDGGVLLSHAEPEVVGMVLAASLFRVGEIDRVVVVAPKESCLFWEGLFTDQTDLKAQTYYGSSRKQRRAAMDPQVLISTSDTLRPELAHREKQSGSRGYGSWALGELGKELAEYRVLWLIAGLDKLDDRGLETYRGFDHFFTQARKRNHQRLVGLRFPGFAHIGNVYDLGRLFCPSKMPSVREFSTEYCFPMLTEQPVLRPDRCDDFYRLFSGVLVS